MPPLLKIVLRRLALGLLTLLLVSIFVFAGTQALPGDTAHAILGRDGHAGARGSAARAARAGQARG